VRVESAARLTVDCVIPALNEATSIGRVLELLPRALVRRAVVSDNGSVDGTADVARAHGALVVSEPERGYGAACLRGIAALELDPPDVVLFLDGDLSDDPSEAEQLVEPIRSGRADLVIGSRTRGVREPGALTPQARFGNWLATRLIRSLYGVRYTDLGPFRAIRWDSLRRLGMRGSRLRVDRRDAGEGGAAGRPGRGGPGPLPQAHRAVQDLGDRVGFRPGRGRDPGHHRRRSVPGQSS
jgi:glycosyltransferase involved in cell wall biosynthesis